jgi:hypothetical protein
MVGWILAGTALAADAAVIAATHSLSFAVAYSLLAVTWALSVAAFLALRSHDDGSDSGGEPEPDPEPPWWPDFERQFRDHVRRRERGPEHRPRRPVAARR